MKRTVRGYLIYKLYSLGFEYGEDVRAAEHAIRHINQNEYSEHKLETKDGNHVTIRSCWNTDADIYNERELYNLYEFVQFEAFLWCLNELHSRK